MVRYGRKPNGCIYLFLFNFDICGSDIISAEKFGLTVAQIKRKKK